MADPLVDDTTRAARLAYWQKQLRLQDWDISVRIMRRHAMPRATSVGSVQIEIYRRANVLLLDPVDFHPDDWPADADLEISLVHELLHCAVYDAGTPTPDSAQDVGLERAIEALAILLVTLDRRPPA